MGIPASLKVVIRPLIPELTGGTVMASASGLVMLMALLSVVKMVGTMSLQWLILALVLWMLSAVLLALSSWICHHAEAKFAARLRRKLAAHLVRLPSSVQSTYQGERLRRLLSDDVAALHHMIAHLPAELSNFIIMPITTIYILVSFAGWPGLLALIPGSIAALFYLIIVPRFAAKQGVDRINRMDKIASSVDDYARGIHIFRIFGVESRALSEYRSSTKLFTKDMMERVHHLATVVAIATALLQALATYSIAYAVGYHWDLQTIAATLFFSLAIVTPALKLGHGLDYVAAGRKAAGRLQAFLEAPALIAGKQAYRPDSVITLRAENLSLMFGERKILHDLTYSFLPRAVTAIMGISGAGKSSLLRLFAGLEQPSAGALYIDDKHYATLNEETQSQLIFFLPQGGDVLASSVRENLNLTCPGTTDDLYANALERAQLPVALDTEAMCLSGGEKQRLNLARAFLTDAPVLLLDEPTAALDHATALKIMHELRELSHRDGKTILIVTHDQASANEADATFVLTNHKNAMESS